MPLDKENVPYVVICHGHGGSRSENGGLDAIAQGLAEKRNCEHPHGLSRMW